MLLLLLIQLPNNNKKGGVYIKAPLPLKIYNMSNNIFKRNNPLANYGFRNIRGGVLEEPIQPIEPVLYSLTIKEPQLGMTYGCFDVVVENATSFVLEYLSDGEWIEFYNENLEFTELWVSDIEYDGDWEVPSGEIRVRCTAYYEETPSDSLTVETCIKCELPEQFTYDKEEEETFDAIFHPSIFGFTYKASQVSGGLIEEYQIRDEDTDKRIKSMPYDTDITFAVLYPEFYSIPATKIINETKTII